jgi:type II secretory pathway component GspD/PulD (secretin)
MRIPFTGNASQTNFEGIGTIFEGFSTIIKTLGLTIPDDTKEEFGVAAIRSASSALDALSAPANNNITYYDAPMEQPFFHVRSIDSSVSVYPGATIVMGGLITEARRAMDDKIPYLGDIPFIGRFFRSHAEQTVKRNLLIFVTTRLVDVRGREVKMNETKDIKDAKPDVQASPAAEATAAN